MMSNSQTPSQTPRHEHWGGSLGFILAAIGSSVGLGNIWKFPYVVGENGGGAFVLIYLFFVALVGLPLMFCEISLGRHSQQSPVGTFKMLAPKISKLMHFMGFLIFMTGIFLCVFESYGFGILALLLGVLIFIFGWRLMGPFCVLLGFLILGFYCVVGGWLLVYSFYAVKELFTAHDLSIFATMEQTSATFQNLAFGATNSVTGTCDFPWLSFIATVIFLVLTAGIVLTGVKKGIERSSKILMPAIFVLIFVLILRGLTLEGAVDGLHTFFTPDFSKIGSKAILSALGHAFFTLSLGMGVMMTYGSYASKKDNLFSISSWIVGMDTLVSLLACFAIFPFVFAMGFSPAEGPGLIFNVLPQAFYKMGNFGMLWAFVFFVLVLVAAITSAISILEMLVATAMENLRLTRKAATLFCVISILTLSLLCVMSLNNWDRLMMLHDIFYGGFGTVCNSFFDFLDVLTSNWMMPIGGFLTVLFVGWIWSIQSMKSELHYGSNDLTEVPLISLLSGLKPTHYPENAFTVMTLIGLLVRFVVPLMIFAVLLHQSGIFS